MSRLLWVFVAGGAGASSRYLVNVWAEQRWGTGFPVATLLVNLAGCFLLGVLMQLALLLPHFPPTLRIALSAGFLGGLTTYSSFNFETTRLVQAGETGRGVVYFAATILGCLVCGLAGMWLARRCV